MNVLVLQKRMSLSNVKLPNIDQIDCQFIGVFLLTDEKNLPDTLICIQNARILC
jgi:hypothetical protein